MSSPHGFHHVRVVLLLKADSGLRAVATIYPGVIRKGGQELQTLHHVLHATSFEVCSAAAAPEQSVAREKHSILFGIEACAAGRMSGSSYDTESRAAEDELLSFMKRCAKLGEWLMLYAHSHDRHNLLVHFAVERPVAGESLSLMMEVTREIPVSPHMVKMKMGVEQMYDVKAVDGKIFAQLLPLALV